MVLNGLVLNNIMPQNVKISQDLHHFEISNFETTFIFSEAKIMDYLVTGNLSPYIPPEILKSLVSSRDEAEFE